MNNELTLQDVRDIVRAADSIIEQYGPHHIYEMGEELYYQMVLDEYRKMKEG